MKTIIERGASWTLEETKMLLALWGQDFVGRQASNQKRTKEVYESISEKFNQSGFERTADQVRTRVFNMIAEYRRILKDPNPERMKKCIFFEALHRIYQAKHMDDVKSALDDYEPECPSPTYSPPYTTFSSEKGNESMSDDEATDGNETTTNNTTSAASNNANNKSGSKSATSDNNHGDSNNNSNKDGKESPKSNHEGKDHAPAAKRYKVLHMQMPESSDDEDSVDNQVGAVPIPSTSATSTKTNSSSSGKTNSNAKQSKTSSATSSAATIAQGLTSPAGTSASTSSTSSNFSTAQRHQSLLLPHATTTPSSVTSTPITSKLTTSGSNNTLSYININNNKLPIFKAQPILTHPNGTAESINLNGTNTRLPTTAAAITGHQLYQAPVNTFDVTSSALLIDRMFAHLSRESENMREWIALEKERLALERTRRQQEIERETRRERVLTDTLMRFQEQWLSFLSRLDPRIVDSATEPLPELKIPSKESASTESTQVGTQSTLGTTTSSTSGLPNAATLTTSSTTSDASK